MKAILLPTIEWQIFEPEISVIVDFRGLKIRKKCRFWIQKSILGIVCLTGINLIHNNFMVLSVRTKKGEKIFSASLSIVYR